MGRWANTFYFSTCDVIQNIKLLHKYSQFILSLLSVSKGGKRKEINSN